MSKLDYLEKELEEAKEKIKKIERKNRIGVSEIRSKEANDKRKKRARHLINLGALFEIIGISDEPYEALLGFILFHKNDYLKNKASFYSEGGKVLEERQIRREQKKKEIKLINSDEIKELLTLETITQINYVAIMQEKFKKKLFEQLSYEEFLFLKNYKGGTI